LISTTAPISGGGDLSADRTFIVATATEGATGVAEIATQAETDAGVDDTRIVTPLKLASFAGGGVGSSQGAVRSTDLTRFSSSLVDDPVLSGFPLQPSESYVIEMVLLFNGSGNATAGFQWDFDFNGELANTETFFGSVASWQLNNATEPLRSYLFALLGGKDPFDSPTITEALTVHAGLVTQSDYIPGTNMDVRWAGNTGTTSCRIIEGSHILITRVT
jgi:hypothetical protein